MTIKDMHHDGEVNVRSSSIDEKTENGNVNMENGNRVDVFRDTPVRLLGKKIIVWFVMISLNIRCVLHSFHVRPISEVKSYFISYTSGYANEVGESFRALVPVSLVRLSYAIATGYVIADTADKSWKMTKV